jgi:hypothetical protein
MAAASTGRSPTMIWNPSTVRPRTRSAYRVIPTRRSDRHARPATRCRRFRRPLWTRPTRGRSSAPNSRFARRLKRAIRPLATKGLRAAGVPVASQSARSRRNMTRPCTCQWQRRTARLSMRKQRLRWSKSAPTGVPPRSALSVGTAAKAWLPAKPSCLRQMRLRFHGCCSTPARRRGRTGWPTAPTRLAAI